MNRQSKYYSVLTWFLKKISSINPSQLLVALKSKKGKFALTIFGFKLRCFPLKHSIICNELFVYDHEKKFFLLTMSGVQKCYPKMFCFTYVKNDSINKQKVLDGTGKNQRSFNFVRAFWFFQFSPPKNEKFLPQ